MSDGRRVDSLEWRQMHLNVAPIHTDRMRGHALVTHGLHYLPARTGARQGFTKIHELLPVGQF